MKKWMKFAVLFVVALVAIAAPSFGAITTNSDVALAADAFPAVKAGQTFVLEGNVDLSTYAASPAAGDRVAVIKIPSGTLLRSVALKVVEAPIPATTHFTNASSLITAALNVGDGTGTGTNSWISGATLTNQTTTMSVPVITLSGTNTSDAVAVAPLNALGKAYVSGGLLYLNFVGAPGTWGKIKVKAEAVKFD